MSIVRIMWRQTFFFKKKIVSFGWIKYELSNGKKENHSMYIIFGIFFSSWLLQILIHTYKIFSVTLL